MNNLTENFLDQLSDIDPDDQFFNQFIPSILDNSCSYYSLENFNSLQKNTVFNLNLLNYNVRSFFSNGLTFECYMKSMHELPNFIVLTETWISAETVNLCKLGGYSAVHTYRDDIRGGGVSIFSRYFEICRLDELCVCNLTIESCVSQIKISNKFLIIIGIYRPHTDTIENFIIALNNILNNPIIKNNELVILTGDFNINLSNLESNSVNNFTSCLNSMHFLPLITRPTRFPPENDGTNPSILDHIWINSMVPYEQGILCMDATDHCPVFILFTYESFEKNKTLKFNFRPFSSNNYDLLCSKLSEIDWNRFLNSTDIDVNCQNFIAKINDLYCQCFPSKTKFVSAKRFEKPWLSPFLIKLIKQKSNYFKLFRMGIISKTVNNSFKNHINKQIRLAKDKYYIEAFDRSKTNIKKSWSILHELMGKKSTRKKINEINFDNVSCTEDGDISKAFNEFFSTAVSNLNENLPSIATSPYSYINNYVQSSFSFKPVTENDCSSLIKKLKITKTDKNHIPVKLFITLHSYLAYPVMKLLNDSLTTGVFPDSLKLARITPVFKKGNNSLPSNYRPIASLPILSKIFERSVKYQLMKFCSDHSIFYKNQFGFMNNKSTCDALIELTENIYDKLNDKKNTLGIAIDLKKAFDSVDHKILLKKLMFYGVRGISLDWFRSYLLNRKQFVRIGSSSSSITTLNISVPQGSILGPVLFLLYINDLPNATNMDSVLYADDSTFLISQINKNTLLEQANEQLCNISEWCSANKLHINSSKTEILKFSNKKIDFSNSFLNFNENQISLSHKFVLLGVIIDENLNFKVHIEAVVAKLARTTGILYKIKNSLSRQAKLNYYYGFIYPFLTYNILIWGSTNSIHLKPLIIQQKRIIRLLSGANYLDHTTPLFYDLNLLKLVDIHKFHASVYMFKRQFNENLTVNHNLNTRNRNELVPKFQRLSRTQQAISYVGPHIWNSLPTSIRNIPKLNTFKSALKRHLLDQYRI